MCTENFKWTIFSPQLQWWTVGITYWLLQRKLLLFHSLDKRLGYKQWRHKNENKNEGQIFNMVKEYWLLVCDECHCTSCWFKKKRTDVTHRPPVRICASWKMWSEFFTIYPPLWSRVQYFFDCQIYKMHRSWVTFFMRAEITR